MTDVYNILMDVSNFAGMRKHLYRYPKVRNISQLLFDKNIQREEKICHVIPVQVGNFLED